MVKYKFRLASLSQNDKPKIIEIDVGPEETVLDVKEKIRKKLNILDILDIQLIWKEDSES